MQEPTVKVDYEDARQVKSTIESMPHGGCADSYNVDCRKSNARSTSCQGKLLVTPWSRGIVDSAVKSIDDTDIAVPYKKILYCRVALHKRFTSSATSGHQTQALHVRDAILGYRHRCTMLEHCTAPCISTYSREIRQLRSSLLSSLPRWCTRAGRRYTSSNAGQ